MIYLADGRLEFLRRYAQDGDSGGVKWNAANTSEIVEMVNEIFEYRAQKPKIVLDTVTDKVEDVDELGF